MGLSLSSEILLHPGPLYLQSVEGGLMIFSNLLILGPSKFFEKSADFLSGRVSITQPISMLCGSFSNEE